ncbi:SusC/RagA family TonB-linked outer membrane protein [Puia dinghuensis]|uniref:SusC/RagA family TonB-linked outer membrane protein n=1 Tax=Puia dinghuensis TaxID=1792502 RepID=A0A8J2XRW7_9BACT|nr:TonB-dependent receptor [Puia dinghuensis]GGB04772.1 SusC/RagA family TonB-linked outer membrane protein [Puia dinghuensis]
MQNTLTKRSKGIFFALLLLLSLAARSQQGSQIKGSVLNDKGDPIEGVTVTASETGYHTTRSTITNDKGVFTFSNLKAGKKYDFNFSYVGFEKQVVKGFLIDEGDNNSILVRLKPAGADLSQVVVIGYGERRKGELTGSVSSLKAAAIKDQVVTSFDAALAGKLAGVQVLQTTGSPGGNVSIHVRGTASISAGNNPLYVIDGYPVSQDVNTNSLPNPNTYQQPLNPLATIDVNDIESIDVLKDAASAAIYGSRGSNGVVLIRTKRGTPGKPKVNYAFSGGFQEVSKRIDVMNAYDYAKEAYDSHNNAYLDAVPTGKASDPNSIRPNNPSTWVPPQTLPYLSNQPGLTNTDWQKAVFRQAFLTNHTLSVSGGSDNLTYYVSGNYLDQDGIIINNNFKRYSLRGQLEAKEDRWKFGLNFSPSYTLTNQVASEGPWSSNGNPYGFPNAAGVVANALTYAPLFPVYNPDGTFADSVNQWGYGQTNVLNPVALATMIKDLVKNFRFTGSTYAEREIIKGLRYRLFFGTDINTFIEDYYRPTNLPIQSATLPSVAYGLTKTDQYLNWVVENTLTYSKRIGAGNLTALLGYNAQKENQYHSYAAANKFPTNAVTTLNAGQPSAVSSTLEQWSLESLLGRLQYDLLNKYFLSASLRRDGSSRFGYNHKWGWFPSASAGWIVSKENFFSGLSRTVSNLKLRASYGLTGNFSIPNYGALAQLTSSNYILGNQALTSGVAVTTPPNPNLTWENTASFDLGMELGFLQNALNITVDYYHSTTSKLLLNVPTPATSGFSTELQNIGQLTNTGVEVSANYFKSLHGGWSIDLSGNIAFNRNRVTRLGPGNAPIIVTGGTGSAYFITKVGQPIGSYYLLVQDGIYRNQEDLNKYPHFSNSHVGDFKFKDVNGDGVLNTLTDRAIVGNFQPNYTFGFSAALRYKNFDIAGVVQGTQGNKILDLFRRYIASSEGNFNNLNLMKGRFEDSNNIGVGYINRANRLATGNNGTISTWHVEDGSFVRIKSLSLGYSFGEDLLKRYGVGMLRLYATVQNPFTFTHYSLFNPEISDRPNNALSPGEDYGSYPLARSYVLGLNLTF